MQGTSGGVMFSKVDQQTYTSEFDSHWVPNSCGLVLHLSKSLVNYHCVIMQFMMIMLSNNAVYDDDDALYCSL